MAQRRKVEKEEPKFSGFAGPELPFERTVEFENLLREAGIELSDARELVQLATVRHLTASVGLIDDVEALVRRLAKERQ